MAFNFDEIIDRHDTNCIKWDRFGKDVIPMFIADMDFSVAPAITERIIKRANHTVYGYSFPDKELFHAVINWVKEEYDYDLKPEWIDIIGGIVPALSVISTIVDGESITNIPNYSMLLAAPGKAGRKMIQVPLRNTDEYYEIDYEALENAITPEVKLFYLCNPHNPVGRIYTREELTELSRFARKHNLIVVSDEIHCELVYDRKHTPFYTVDDYARDHSITLNAPGKICNVPGVNLAIAIVPNKELKESLKKAGYAMGHPGIFEIQAAIAAYSEAKEWKKELVEYLRGNRDYLESELKRWFPRVRLPHLESTYLQWADFRAYGEQYTAEYFLKEAKIAFTDGKDFGSPGYIRINFGCPRAVLTEAIERLKKTIKIY